MKVIKQLNVKSFDDWNAVASKVDIDSEVIDIVASWGFERCKFRDIIQELKNENKHLNILLDINHPGK